MPRVSRLLGLLSADPLKRIRTLEELTAFLLWRLPRESIDAHVETPPRLPGETLTEAKLYSFREDMLEVLPKGGEIAEVGVWEGGFSHSIAAICKPRLFHLIDLDFSRFDWTRVQDVDTVKHQGDSSTILRGFAPASLDWAYIDGDHSYEGCRKDLEASHMALKPGGFLMCNDYSNWCALDVSPYGVARAVNEFIIREGYVVAGLSLNSGFLPDLLIRKPD